MNKESDFQEQWLKNATITIYGLGLMGASLAMALRRAGIGKLIQAIDINPDSIQTGLDLGIIDYGSTTPGNFLPQSDLIILAMPVGAICETLENLNAGLKTGVIVTDLGSTKVEITKRMENLPQHIAAVGGHPMCGMELNGIGAAKPDLYDGENFFLIPTSHTTTKTLSVLQYLISAIGAMPILTEAETHDQITALTSHLPYLISVALLTGVQQCMSGTDLAEPYIGSGFQDMTRIAGSDKQMMLDILLTNRRHILTGLASVEQTIVTVRRLLETEQNDALQKLLTVQMDNSRQMNTRKMKRSVQWSK